MVSRTCDIAVVGAGVFGAWIAYRLQSNGAEVLILDRYGPANSRASSGGESRIMRMGYGPDELYTLSARQSLVQWLSFFERVGCDSGGSNFNSLFHRTGVLWLAREGDKYSEATLATLKKLDISHELLDSIAIQQRYPLLRTNESFWGILETGSGALMARQAVRAVMDETIRLGATYLAEEALPPSGSGRLEEIRTREGSTFHARHIVFACGPWLPKIFPELLGQLIHVTRQEVFFLSVPFSEGRGWGEMPIWLDFNDLVYAIPNVDGRGLKVALDEHGPEFDPDEGDRLPSVVGIKALRSYLSERAPSLQGQPILESRVCQYENTSNGDFLIDLHPAFENVWLVGGGSGHGFKHGPAVGEYVTGLIRGIGEVEGRFTLKTKQTWQRRQVF